MEDCLIEVLVLCLEKNVVIPMLAPILTIMTLMVIPENRSCKKYI